MCNCLGYKYHTSSPPRPAKLRCTQRMRTRLNVGRTSDPIGAAIADKTGREVQSSKQFGSSGWSSQIVYHMTDGGKFFVKTSQRSAEEMFRGEALGLRAMYDTHTLRVPEVIDWGDFSHGSYLITEYLEFGGRVNQEEMGRLLAQMHLAVPKEGDGQFGFPVDNTIGGTEQPNSWDSSWVNFFREQRLMHQVKLTGNKSLIALGKLVADRLEVLFEGIDVSPSVLHGDLWSGNMAAVERTPADFEAGARPYIQVMDPAVYYGHSEAEFGMSWCAGFSDAFYRAYFEVIPKQPGFDKRRDLYLAYHYLNHYNLFGSGYRGESERLLRKVQKAVGA